MLPFVNVTTRKFKVARMAGMFSSDSAGLDSEHFMQGVRGPARQPQLGDL